MSDLYTYAQKHAFMIGIISDLDNRRTREQHPGNKHALETQLGVAREILKDVHDLHETRGGL